MLKKQKKSIMGGPGDVMRKKAKKNIAQIP